MHQDAGMQVVNLLNSVHGRAYKAAIAMIAERYACAEPTEEEVERCVKEALHQLANEKWDRIMGARPFRTSVFDDDVFCAGSDIEELNRKGGGRRQRPIRRIPDAE
jgi:hypothetical protein